MSELNQDTDAREIEVEKFAHSVKTTITAIYNRIELKVIKVLRLRGRQKLLDPVSSRIRYSVGERLRTNSSLSLREIGRRMEDREANKIISEFLQAGMDESKIADYLVSIMEK